MPVTLSAPKFFRCIDRFFQEPPGAAVITLLVCLMLAAVTFWVYLPAGDHTFFILDQNDHVTDNPYLANGLTGAGIAWAFTSVAAFNWHPVTWLTHMTVAQFYGMDPRAHHLANVLFHVASSVALFLLFLRLTGARWQSLFVAALFALHPMHVESVAWVAERKDVLSALFGFLTLMLYAEYVTRDLHPTLYLCALLSFLPGLMSKSMLVTLPVVMLLLDFWPLDRYRSLEHPAGLSAWRTRAVELFREKVPFFVCSLVTGIIAVYAQNRGGAAKSFDAVPFPLRIENALTAYLKYLGKLLWPVDLGVLYPLPSAFPLWQVAGSLVVLLLVTAAVVRSARRHPYLLVGWLWFLVTLLPVIGLLQVGSQAMADRYTYIPGIGLFVMVAWGIPILLDRLPYRKALLSIGMGVVLIALTALTHRQLGYWRDSMTIFRHTLAVTGDNYLVNDLMGVTLAKRGDWEGAVREFREAVRVNPRDAAVRRNLGVTLAEKGDREGAIEQYREALRITPGDAGLHDLLGATLLENGDADGARQECRTALRISPNDINAQQTLQAADELKK